MVWYVDWCTIRCAYDEEATIGKRKTESKIAGLQSVRDVNRAVALGYLC